MPLRHYSSASGVPSSPAVPRPLLALRGASAEWRVGVTPHCAATVRLLLARPAFRGNLARRAIGIERELERLGGRLRNRLFGARGDERSDG